MDNKIDDVVNILSAEHRIVEAHEGTRIIHESVIVPSHEERTESNEFHKSKNRLREDGHFHCWICGTEEKLEVHHFIAEWSLADYVDFKKMKDFCENEWDPYGYGRLLKNTPINSVDDIRNMLVLCEQHHVGVNDDNYKTGTGIHSLSFPIFIIQKVCKEGCNPVPQRGQKAEDMVKTASIKKEGK